MRVEAALVDFLRRDGGVLGLTDQGKRLYRGRALPDAAFPRLHYWLVSETDDYTLQGAQGQPTAKFRLEALGRGPSGYEDARALADAVKNAKAGGTQPLKSWVAALFPPAAPSQLFVQAVRVTEVQAGEEEMPAAGGPKVIFVAALDVTICYVEG